MRAAVIAKVDDGDDGGQADLIGEDPHAEGADELHDDGARHVGHALDDAQ